MLPPASMGGPLLARTDATTLDAKPSEALAASVKLRRKMAACAPATRVSWASYLVAACLWMIRGVRKHDKSVHLACIGWIILHAAIVIGVIVRQ